MLRLIPIIAALVLLSACWQTREDHMWHQKLTLVIDTPEGEIKGSSVIAVRARFFDPPQMFGSAEVAYEFTGEAVVVEVQPGKYLFALLGDPSEIFYAAARERFEGLTRRKWLFEIPKQTEAIALTGKLIPLLVTFDDVTKPETVRRVDPADLAATFGPGFALKAVTLEITDEPVTAGRVEKLLEWLGPFPEPALGPATGGTTNIPFYRLVHMGDFIRRAL